MSTTRKYTNKQIKAEVGRFDWSAVDALSDRQIEQAARSDPDTVLLTEADLAKADVVIPARARRRRQPR